MHGALSRDRALRLAAEIKTLLEHSHEPITIAIKSSGGKVEAFFELETLFNAQDQANLNGQIITSARQAGSAAACLLVAGHFAYATRQARIFFHGTRFRPPVRLKMLKRENALALAMRLDRENRKVASMLAKRVVARMARRYLGLKLSARNRFFPDRPWIFFKNFADAIRPQLSSRKAEKLLYESLDRLKLILAVKRYYPTSMRRINRTNFAPREASLCKAVVDYETNARESEDWSLDSTATAELMMDYLLARDHVRGEHLATIQNLTRGVGMRFFTTAENRKCAQLRKTDPAMADAYLLRTVMPRLLGFWYFASTLCHRLLSGENSLSAKDAYWLGLIDDILD
ncbi:MAG TPA: ATP-dependent Clp protease proteolytic subunit [Opitutales bacterium]|nr:ATP-dependent Clp protease proteolytic subunit [Opitutales bacterium]